eukprot:Opistho-2@8300
MPPKKVVQEERPLLGRVGTNLRMGIVGLPNVGKSTFFNVLTNSSAAAENFPFCTIDPNESRCAVPDERFDWLCEHHKPASKVPAYLQITDIAGLVKGASEGQGLGNAFLSHIRAVDGIFHVVRAFEDEDVVHVDGDVNPVRDLEVIHEELRKKDEEYIVKQLDTAKKAMRGNADKAKKTEAEILEKIVNHVVTEKKDARFNMWSAKDIEVLNEHLLITKPVVYLVNLTEDDYIRKKNKWLPKIIEWVHARDNNDVIIPFSGVFESKLVGMASDAERKAYCDAKGATSVLSKIIKTGYKALQLEYFFTAGSDEVRAWTIRKGTKAPEAAGKIHGDFEKFFVMAEVMAFNAYKEHGSENAVKAAGKYGMEGKNYVVNDGDIIFFKSNPTNQPAAKKK